MTTLLLLGGSKQQVVAIDTAKRLGFRTVLCDYLDDNPGQYHADEFYLVSTTDKDAVLDVAKKENVDGIVAYASDPAAPTAAYVSEKLGLPGLPYEMAMNFCEKHRFRRFLKDNGFNVPKSVQVTEDAPLSEDDLASMMFPLIVKPTDSSGSKGVTVIRGVDELPDALEYARSYSRNKVLIVEEFIERAHPHVIEAELTICDGKVKTWGLINSIRDTESNPLLPSAYSFPLEVTSEQKRIVEDEVAALVDASGMKYGSFNIEMIIDKHNRLFFLDAGPRNGGNMLPDYISLICGGDIVEATVLMSIGKEPADNIALSVDAAQCWGLAVLHSPRGGVFKDIIYSQHFKECIIREYLFVNSGETIRSFTTCNDLLGLVFLRFEDERQKREIMNNLSQNVEVIVEEADF